MLVQLFEKRGLICRNHFLYSMHARYMSLKNGTNSSLTFAQTKLRRMCWKFWDWNCTDMTRRREPRAPKLFFGTVAYSCSLGQVDLEPKPWAVENNAFREQTKSGSMGKQLYVLLLHSPRLNIAPEKWWQTFLLGRPIFWGVSCTEGIRLVPIPISTLISVDLGVFKFWNRLVWMFRGKNPGKEKYTSWN